MRPQGGYLITGGGDPLTGEYNLLEQRLLFASGGRVLFLVTEEVRELAQAWREVYARVLGAKATGLVVVKSREVALDRVLARRVAEARLVWLASRAPRPLLDRLWDTPLLKAPAAWVPTGGHLGAFGETSAALGATAPLPEGERTAFAYGLALLPGVVAFPGFERPGSFEALAQATAAQPDLTGVGLPRGSALGVDLEGNARVLQGRVTRLGASTSQVHHHSIRGLVADLLAAGERFKLPVYRPGA